ncbi:hypothetical protein LBMAG46_07530 [Planctomycetia bacterium]|nr:hypothetical protein LBMAG46_07530 [Planctomycetia bacterium]
MSKNHTQATASCRTDLGLESPSYLNTAFHGPPPFAPIRVHSWFKTAEHKGAFTPHPHPLSTARGEGCQVVISG